MRYRYKTIYDRWMDEGETPIGKILRAYDPIYRKLWLEHKSSQPRIFYPNGSLILLLEDVPPQGRRIPTYCEVLIGGQKGRIMISALKFSYPKELTSL